MYDAKGGGRVAGENLLRHSRRGTCVARVVGAAKGSGAPRGRRSGSGGKGEVLRRARTGDLRCSV